MRPPYILIVELIPVRQLWAGSWMVQSSLAWLYLRLLELSWLLRALHLLLLLLDDLLLLVMLLLVILLLLLVCLVIRNVSKVLEHVDEHGPLLFDISLVGVPDKVHVNLTALFL